MRAEFSVGKYLYLVQVRWEKIARCSLTQRWDILLRKPRCFPVSELERRSESTLLFFSIIEDCWKKWDAAAKHNCNRFISSLARYYIVAQKRPLRWPHSAFIVWCAMATCFACIFTSMVHKIPHWKFQPPISRQFTRDASMRIQLNCGCLKNTFSVFHGNSIELFC